MTQDRTILHKTLGAICLVLAMCSHSFSNVNTTDCELKVWCPNIVDLGVFDCWDAPPVIKTEEEFEAFEGADIADDDCLNIVIKCKDMTDPWQQFCSKTQIQRRYTIFHDKNSNGSWNSGEPKVICWQYYSVRPPDPATITCPEIWPIWCKEVADYKPPKAAYSNGSSNSCAIEGWVDGKIIDAPADGCGGYLTIEYSGWDNCGRELDPVTCKVKVEPTALPTISCPDLGPIWCKELADYRPEQAHYSNEEMGDCLIEGYVNGKVVYTPEDCCGGYLIIEYAGKDKCGRPLEAVRCSIEVLPPNDIVVSCPDDKEILPCKTRNQIKNKFEKWLEGFTATGGSNLTILIYDAATGEPPKAPPGCGGSVTVKITAFDMNCLKMEDECKATFTVPAPPKVEASCPGDKWLEACDDKTEEIFKEWLGKFQVRGGCNPSVEYDYRLPGGDWIEVKDISEIPFDGVCGGSIEVCISGDDGCSKNKCVSKFSIEKPDPVVAMCPPAKSLDLCDGRAKEYFQKWLLGFKITGGCNPSVEYDYRLPGGDWIEVKDISEIPFDGVCGGSIEVCISGDDGCSKNKCVSKFSIEKAEPVVAMCPPAKSLDLCDGRAKEYFQKWLLGFKITGGCNPSVEYDYRLPGGDWIEVKDISEIPFDGVCGGSIEVCISGDDGCSKNKCVSKFSIEKPDPVVAMCPPAKSLDLCDGRAKEYFQKWLLGFKITGGCNPSVEYDYRLPGGDWIEVKDISEIPFDGVCGGSIEVCISGDDGCSKNKCVSKFSIEKAEPVVAMCPPAKSLDMCDGRAKEYFQKWLLGFKITGGCNPSVEYDYRLPGGDWIEVKDISEIPFDGVCGGSIEVCISGDDGCSKNKCVSKFSIEKPEPVVAMCPPAKSLDMCDVRAKEYFQKWLLGFKITGGCNPSVEYDYRLPGGDWIEVKDISEIPFDGVCGGSIEVCISGDDGCSKNKCVSKFSIEKPDPVVVTCPDPVKLETCPEDLESKFRRWLNAFERPSGGCDAKFVYLYQIRGEDPVEVKTRDEIPTPEACGGAIKVTCRAWDGCTRAECNSSFSVEAAPKLEIKCPADGRAESCLTDDQVKEAFHKWLRTFEGPTGGCDPQTEYFYFRPDQEPIPVRELGDIPVPSRCGDMVTVMCIAKDRCTEPTRCTSTYYVDEPDPIRIQCPSDKDIEACLTQDEVEVAFKTWLQGFVSGGGCNVKARFEGNPQPPAICGGEVIVTYIATDDCKQERKCSAKFSVKFPQKLEANCPASRKITACTSQEQIDIAFDNWLKLFTYKGGCTVVESGLGGKAPLACEGGKVVITYVVSDHCQKDECTATFEVDIKENSNLSISCPADVEEDADQTQAVIDVAFEAWKKLFTYSGGCNTTVVFQIDDIEIDFDALAAPDACGGDVKVEMVVTSDCLKDSCESEFVVIATAKALITSNPLDKLICKDSPGVPSVEDVPDARSDDAVIDDYVVVSACVPIEEVKVVDVLLPPEITGATYKFTRIYEITAPNVSPSEVREVFIFTHDPEPPVLHGVPESVTLPCGSSVPEWPIVTAKDLVDGYVEVVRWQVKETGACGRDSYLRTWTAKDDCGNMVTKYQSIVIGEDLPPVLKVPNDTIIYCGEIPAPYYELDPTECVKVNVEFSEVKSDENECEFTITRTWTATSRCGSSTVKTQVIQLKDDVAPVITLVNPMLVGLEKGGVMKVYGCETPQVQMGDIEVSGECCGAASIETDDRLVGSNLCDVFGYYRKWRCSYTVTDHAGNVSVFYFDVHQYDTTAPAILNVPEDVDLECGSDFPPIDQNVIVDDDCSMATTPEVSELFFADPDDTTKFAKVRTWYYVDACGNRGEESQILTICGFDTMLLKSAIGNTVWFDANQDGIQNTDEDGLNDVKVYLYHLKDDGSKGPILIDSATTRTIDDKTGQFNFEHLTPSAYQLRFVAPEAMSFTLSNQGDDSEMDSDVDPNTEMTGIIFVQMGEHLEDIDAGFVPAPNSYVDMNSFSATNNGCENILVWVTSSEKEIEKYVVERSAGGAEYLPIGEVRAIGGLDLLIQYQYEDPNPMPSNLYRLKIMDKQDYARYTEIRSAPANCRRVSNGFSIFPNPTGGRARLSFTTSKIQEVHISVYDHLGKELKRITGSYDKGIHTEIIDLSSLPQGLYYVRLNQDGIIDNRTIVKSE